MSIHISYSLLAEYLSCQRKPLYRIQFPELFIPNKEMVIGSAVHSALEKHSDDYRSAVNYAINYLDLNSLNDRDNAGFAIKCLDNFFENFSQHLKVTDAIEYKFKIALADGIFLVGKIDRISDKKLFDWKTTRNPPSRLFNDLQFIIYNWAYRRTFGEPPIANYYGALSTGNLVQHVGTEDAEIYVFNEIIPQVIHNIKDNIFPHTGFFTKACYRCPYKDTCLKEYRKNVMDSGAFTSE